MSGTMTMILPLIILLLVMYFLLIRPQKKREKEVNAMRSGVQVGDEIITIGGICGKICLLYTSAPAGQRCDYGRAGRRA